MSESDPRPPRGGPAEGAEPDDAGRGSGQDPETERWSPGDPADQDPAGDRQHGLGTGYARPSGPGVRWSDTAGDDVAPRSWAGAPFGGHVPSNSPTTEAAAQYSSGDGADYGWGRTPAGGRPSSSGTTATPPGGFPSDPGAGWGGTAGPDPGAGWGGTPAPDPYDPGDDHTRPGLLERVRGGGREGAGAVGRTGLILVALVALVAGLIGGAIAGSLAAGGTSGTSLASSGSSDDLPPAPAGSVESIASTVLPSTVQIIGAAGEGSGVVISPDGLIMTNNHVLAAGRGGALQAVFSDGRVAPVSLVGTAPAADIAVVRATGMSGLQPAVLGDSDKLRQGQAVVAIGSPLGLQGTVTTGIVSALQRPVAAGGSSSGADSTIDAIQTDAAINPGNSGGPLADSAGHVIGVNTAIASVPSGGGSGGQEGGSIGLGFAIPVNQARRIATELVQTGRATQAIIGVQLANGGPRGATVAVVTPGSPAAAAGIVPGDLVTKVDNRVIEDANALVAAIQSSAPNQVVTLTVASQGAAPRQVPVTLGSRVIGGR
ncbi:trypsin-like peptidase domain-containing protein [Actinomycetospora endophytica]|uniref:Trypsin-like peptidase domain-containing protein n=1 Tax=Actinomycetospora endophytica TaxID=2291215 RepID=A0ABS8PGI1_9PSEU|nr:trypsin-like peptidase domain-containing protein [Actinomycetospora endophytica]MCD2197365.1 trypsin-like peptidase domain-containing protein [Actinomycetospora endophytica]